MPGVQEYDVWRQRSDLAERAEDFSNRSQDFVISARYLAMKFKKNSRVAGSALPRRISKSFRFLPDMRHLRHSFRVPERVFD